MTEHKRFTADELAFYDGKDGRPAYVAYEGHVYDVTASKLWRNGVHLRQHNAGQDLTREMAGAPHTEIVMDGFVVVGQLVAARAASLPEPPPFIAWILDRHPHPIAVHFPIALGFVAALLTLLSLFVRNSADYDFIVRAAFYNLLICALGTPPAIASGLLSWYYNHGMAWTRVYKWKVWLSVLLALIGAAALFVRLTLPGGAEDVGTPYLAYTLLVLAHAPVVVGLGYWGGKITFPS